MSEKNSENGPPGAYDKGDRAAIVAGRKGLGVRGQIFWIGENKYGSGMRYGLRGDDGQTYWVDEASLGPEADAPPPPEAPAAKPALDKGTVVRLVGTKDAGKTGSIFWVGESKYGVGMRYGVRVDGEEDAAWVDEANVEVVEGAARAEPVVDEVTVDDMPPLDVLPPADGPPPFDDGPPLFDDDLPPEAFEDATEDDPPF